jgi:multidrug efflux system outer membrane protein
MNFETTGARGVGKWIVAFFGLIGCSGCVIVGPDYTLPETPVSESFVGKDVPGAVQGAAVEKWWYSFADKQLEELILRAVHENNDLEVALERVNQTRALRREAFLGLFPIVTSAFDYTNTHIPTSTFAGGALRLGKSHIDNEVYSAGFDAFWEVDVFGRVRRGVEARTADSEAAVAQLQDAVRILIGDVARNYFQLRGLQTQLAVAQENTRTQEQVVRVAEALFKGGQTTEFDVVRAKSQLSSTLASIPVLEANIQATVYRLAVLTARQPGELNSQLIPSKPIPTYNGPVTLGNPEELLKRRPDIRAAERSLASATAQIGVAEGDLFPKLTFTGSISLQARYFDKLNDDNSDAWNLGPRLSWAAFDLGRVLARIDASEAVARQSLAQYEQTVLLALEDVEGSLARFKGFKLRRDHLQDAVVQSGKAVALARTQYENGLIDILPVLDAQRSALIAQLSLAESQTDLLTALVAVFKAVGGGWDEAIVEVQATPPQEGDTPPITNVGVVSQ